jgi:hypothetical protein
MTIPTEYIVAMGNAFFLDDGFVMAAPILVETNEPDWTEAGEVTPDSDADPVVIAIIHNALTALWVQSA